MANVIGRINKDPAKLEHKNPSNPRNISVGLIRKITKLEAFANEVIIQLIKKTK